MNADLIETEGVWRPIAGQPIFVEGRRAMFGGYVEEVTEKYVPGNQTGIMYTISCVDYSRLLDWRLYAGSFPAGTPFRTVVETIHGAKLAGDGIELGYIPSTPLLTARLQDGMRPVTEWFRKLSTETGYIFWIDNYKALHFGPLATSPVNPAPFSLTWNSRNWRDITIRKSMGDYRNRQYVRTEYTTSGVLEKSWTADGATRDFFQFDGPYEGSPTVTLDAAPLTVGQFGIDTGKDIYYDVEGWGLHYIPPAVPAASAVLVASYRVRFNNTYMVQDSVQIAARAAIQGDSGLIEAIHEDRYIDTRAGLESRGNGLLAQFGSIPTEVRFDTDSYVERNSDDLDPGMLISIDLTDGPSALAGLFKVESIDSAWTYAAEDDFFRHSVNCTSDLPFGMRLAGPLERLVEISRIGPDVGALITESPESPASAAVPDRT